MNEITRIINNALRDVKFIQSWEYNYFIDSFDKTEYLKIMVDFTSGKYITKIIPLFDKKLDLENIINVIMNYYYEN